MYKRKIFKNLLIRNYQEFRYMCSILEDVYLLCSNYDQSVTFYIDFYSKISFFLLFFFLGLFFFQKLKWLEIRYMVYKCTTMLSKPSIEVSSKHDSTSMSVNNLFWWFLCIFLEENVCTISVNVIRRLKKHKEFYQWK